MPLQTQSIPNLYGGVSQQAAMTRSINQCEDAVNCSFSVAKGVSKRPPLEIVNLLTSFPTAGSKVAWLRHSSDEWIVMIIPGDGSYRAYRVETGGQLTTVGADTNITYLMCDGLARDCFRVVQADDRAFIANLEKTITLTTAQTSNFTLYKGAADNLQSTDLDNPTNGDLWLIHGTEQNPFDDYYVKRAAGEWVEWVAPNIPYKLDATTMPLEMEIIDTASLETPNPERFELEIKELSWGERQVGSTKSNKAPSFVGQSLSGIEFIADRLTLLAGKDVVMSEVGEYENFWRTTVLDVLDSDRIDVSLKHADAGDANWIESASGEYVIFAGDRQFNMAGNPALTPSTIAVKPITKYPSSAKTRPQAAGPNIYFASESGNSTHVREMFLQEDSITLDASDAASHVFNYIPKTVSSFAVNSDHQIILMASEEEPNNIYAYQYMWLGNQKTLSAWGRWELADDPTIINLQVIDQWVYVVFVHSNGDLMLGRFNVNPGDFAPGFTHKVHLDYLERPAVSYNSAEDRTYFTVSTPVVTEMLHDPAVIDAATSDVYITESVTDSAISFINGDEVRVWDFTEGFTVPDGLALDSTIVVHRAGTDETYQTTPHNFSFGNDRLSIEYLPADSPAWVWDVAVGKYVEFVGFADDGAFLGSPEQVLPEALRYSGVSRLVKGSGFSDQGKAYRPNEVPGFTISDTVFNTQFYLPGNWSGGDWWFGTAYEQRYRFSKQFARDGSGVAQVNARMQLRDLIVHWTETPYFRIRTSHRGASVQISTVIPVTDSVRTSRTLNDDWFRLNVPTEYSGTFKFPVLAGADDAVIEILNESYLPANMQAAEWKALISTKFGR